MQLDASITAVVTGGASGLGAATARRLASRGVKVALFGSARDKDRLPRADDTAAVVSRPRRVLAIYPIAAR